jgi:pentatricopeptide repeat protein
VGNALIDMYSKCGSVELACHVFEKMSMRNEVSWTSMISGYGMNGYGEDALAHFKKMQTTRLIPNHITFVAVLSACSHAGLVSEGKKYFECMSRDYQITPRLEHYACVVDLLGRAGLLDEAESFIQAMPAEPNASVWGALLAACTTHGNLNLGQRVGEQLLELESDNDGNYILLSNIYAAAGKWDRVANVRAIMKARGLKQRPGCSWIRVKTKVHRFFVGDRSHPQSEDIYAMLESLTEQLRELGYFPDTRVVLHNVDEEEKENILNAHSEKLAIAFGVIKTCPGTPIRIIKNLRMCRDCHSATKYISRIVSREIFVRDTTRFHRFKDGVCSCGDYW